MVEVNFVDESLLAALLHIYLVFSLINLDIRVPPFKLLFQLLIVNYDSRKLVAQRDPPMPPVVRSRKQLHLHTPRVHPLYHIIDLIRLSTSLADLGDYYIAVHIPVDFGVPFDADKTVLLGVVEPVAGPPCPDDPLELVGLYPYNLLDSLVAPNLETFSA